MAILRRHRLTQKYTAKPPQNHFNAGLCKGLFGYFSKCCSNPIATLYTNSKLYWMTHRKMPPHKLQHICRHTKPSAQKQTGKRAAILPTLTSEQL